MNNFAELDKNNKRVLQHAWLLDRVHPARLQTYLMQITEKKKNQMAGRDCGKQLKDSNLGNRPKTIQRLLNDSGAERNYKKLRITNQE